MPFVPGTTRIVETDGKIYAIRTLQGNLMCPNDQDMYQRMSSVTAPYRRWWQGTIKAADHAFEHPREYARNRR